MNTLPSADWRPLAPAVLLIAAPLTACAAQSRAQDVRPSAAQVVGTAGAPAATAVPAYTPELDRDSAWYTVAGSRHGISFFPRARHEGVEYEAAETLTFDRYHTVDVMYEWLQRWAERYPELVGLYEVGRSYEGRPILQVTLTNRATGSDLDKPAAFFGGDSPAVEIMAPETRDTIRDAGWLQAGEVQTVHFQLRTRGEVGPFNATVELLSTRGGRSERTIEIGG